MDPQEEFQQSVRAFWDAKAKQAETGGGEGSAGAVRGGKHFDTLQDLVAKVFLDEGFTAAQMFTGRAATLPGYYRPTKNWDLVVLQGMELVAAFELKSLGGPAFGNNSNNRAEEAIGNAIDVRSAYDSGNLGKIAPWLGYLYVVEDAPGSRSPVKGSVVAGKVAPELKNLSYQQRAEMMCLRLQKHGVYDAMCVVASSKDPTEKPKEQHPELSWDRFVTAIRERIDFVKATLPKESLY